MELEIKITNKMIDTFGEFINAVHRETNAEIVGDAGKAIYTTIAEWLVDYYADGEEEILTESMPNWRDYDEIPDIIIAR